MLRVDVEEEDCVLLGAWYPEWLAMAGATHTFLLPTATHHDSKCMLQILNVQ